MSLIPALRNAGVEINDCMMIEDDDRIFLSQGEAFLQPNVNVSASDELAKASSTSLIKLDYYNPFDFYNEKDLYIELKARRCQINTYESTMVGMNKINKAKILTRKNNNVYFCFYFTKTDFSECDLYYWKFNITEFDKCEFKTGGRIDRGKSEIKKYCYIPISLLTKI